MKNLQNTFSNRQDLTSYVKELSPWAKGQRSSILGGHTQGLQKLDAIDPIAYASTRNYGSGKVTKLSPFIHHGILSLNDVRNHALKLCDDPKQITKFIQELAWRDFWQRVAFEHPDWLWNDIEEYKTGYKASDYATSLPEDILNGSTGVYCIDAFIKHLLEDGYVHNHARMYLASYVVHFRKIRWQAGAQWFLEHLLDGDEASNNLSWQWVASTFSQKPYIFNLENVDKYFSDQVDTSKENNQELDASYEELKERLFPNLESSDE